VTWSRAHWLVGLLTLIAFPLTGAYMLHIATVPYLDTVPRLIFRSRHLFLLMAAVVNLALSNSQPIHCVQRVASLLIMLAPLLLITAFFVDPARGLRSSQMFHFAMYGLFAAGVLLAIANRPRRASK
jgi:hypothetical protein